MNAYLYLLALTVRSSLAMINCPISLGQFKTENEAQFYDFFIPHIYRTLHITLSFPNFLKII